jgi:hypothetical protein
MTLPWKVSRLGGPVHAPNCGTTNRIACAQSGTEREMNAKVVAIRMLAPYVCSKYERTW